jgi:Family of unknown function (DUF6152)
MTIRTTLATVAILTAVLSSGIPAIAHHSQALYFDMSKAITLQGEIVRVEWINPHILVFIQSKNEKGEMETWILQGSSLGNANARVGLKEELKPGTVVSARVHLPRNPLYVNDSLTVLLTRPEDSQKNSHIVAGGEIRLPNGDIHAVGGSPKF